MRWFSKNRLWHWLQIPGQLKRFQVLSLLPVLLSLLCAALLIGYLFTPEHYASAALVAITSTIILTIGFRILTQKRSQVIRSQLFQILSTLEKFDIDEPTPVEFAESPFPVFNDLNEYLLELIDKVRENYQAHKQFTENASHELQTPLAVIKGHVEMLLQSPRIEEKEMESLAVVLQNTNRLAKLNSALILLSKIEHQRFLDTEKVSFEKMVEEVLKNFKDLITIQEIQIIKKYEAPFEVEMSHTLAEILIANLIQNAIRYNDNNGFIEIKISTSSFSISNPGQAPRMPIASLFKRFKRDSAVEESLGLGLPIVKKICEQFDLTIHYHFENGIHQLHIQAAP